MPFNLLLTSPSRAEKASALSSNLVIQCIAIFRSWTWTERLHEALLYIHWSCTGVHPGRVDIAPISAWFFMHFVYLHAIMRMSGATCSLEGFSVGLPYHMMQPMCIKSIAARKICVRCSSPSSFILLAWTKSIVARWQLDISLSTLKVAATRKDWLSKYSANSVKNIRNHHELFWKLHLTLRQTYAHFFKITQMYVYPQHSSNITIWRVPILD